ncbi:hypothetical protein [Actinorugispora endophytica]|uniref:GcrA cell cycle regulator n=1 Tax=Actinorugispora endophytica TaxID=1605990 RepID=A0A4R6V2U1_9ACTN|nr:hypothetical protein [Actinorugispora endophytica]TDQ53000.1 hypothetical protein EV190_105117 [Actinorugispora endophytica]
MDNAGLRALKRGPVPDKSRCRDVAYEDLHPGECDEQTAYGAAVGSTYCGAPKAEGFKLCLYHLFNALNGGVPKSRLRG